MEGNCREHDDCLVNRVSAMSFNYSVFIRQRGNIQENALLPSEVNHARACFNTGFDYSNEESRTSNESVVPTTSCFCKGNMNGRHGPQVQFHSMAFMNSERRNVIHGFPFASFNERYTIPNIAKTFALRPRSIFLSPMHQDMQKNLGQTSGYKNWTERSFPSQKESHAMPNLTDATELFRFKPRPGSFISRQSNLQTNTGRFSNYYEMTKRSSNVHKDEISNEYQSFSIQNQSTRDSGVESELQKKLEADKLASSSVSTQFCDNPGDDTRAVTGPSLPRYDEQISTECGTEIPSNRQLEQKSAVKSKKKPFVCDVCQKCYSRKFHLNRHMLSHTGIKSHNCVDCGKAFTLQHHLRAHMRIHSGIKSHKCGDCGKAFTLKHHLRAHMPIHTGERPFRCDTCGTKVSSKSQLEQHSVVHSKKKPFVCALCQKCYSRKGHLNRHMLSHTGIKPHKCGDCGKAFTLQHHLRAHMRIHSGKKSHKSGDCGKAFTLKNHLRAHMPIHTGERPFRCDTCGTEVPSKLQLEQHSVVHSKKKPFVCALCQKCYSRKGHLNRHMLSHTGKKHHKCGDCGKAFTLQHHLRAHLSIHPQEKGP